MPIGIYVYPSPVGITFKANFDGRGHAVKGMYTSLPGGQYATGLFEYAEGARISNLGIEEGHITARPTVTEDDAGVGSIVGYMYGGSVLENCWNTAKITASGSCGSYYLCVGGLAGIAYTSTVINCYNAGDINVQPTYNFGIAGLVGSFFGVNTVYTYAVNSYNVGNIKIAASSGYQHIGGITNDLGVTYNCYNAGKIEISGGSTARYLGGIAGMRSSGSANHSYFLSGTASYATYNNTYAANCSSFNTSGNLTASVSINGTAQTTLLGALNSFANKTAYISGYAPASTPLKKWYISQSSPYPVFIETVDTETIQGVAPPATGAAAVTSIAETAQYTASISWSPALLTGNRFASGTSYTATVTIAPKTGYTVEGVVADFFKVSGATATNAANSGTVTAVFPATAVTINIPNVAGVTAPAAGATAAASIAATAQYTASISWSPSLLTGNKFASGTAYTATITVTPKTGYTLTGVTADFFKVAGATATNAANSGTVTAVFPATAAAVSTPNISGVTPPATGAAAVTSIAETAQYAAFISWSPSLLAGNKFASDTVYTATITVNPKAGYTLFGVPANFFKISGAAAANAVNGGTVTAVFQATDATINLPNISGVTVPAAGAAAVTSATETAQYTASISWSPSLQSGRFAAGTAYTATITVTPKTGYTLTGVTADFFKVAGAAAANQVNSGTVTAVFPATASMVNMPNISGVTAPATGAAAVTSIAETAQYTASISWSPSLQSGRFAAGTAYTATITIAPKAGYTLFGVPANYFKIAGATATNAVNGGTVTASFTATGYAVGVPSDTAIPSTATAAGSAPGFALSGDTVELTYLDAAGDTVKLRSFHHWTVFRNDSDEEITVTQGTNGKATFIMPGTHVAAVAVYEYIIRFDSNGGNTVGSVSALAGGTITEPASPSRAGYMFNGWYETDGYDNGGTWGPAYIFDRMAGSGFTLHAKWNANPYTVSFDYRGGTGGDTDRVVYYDSAYGADSPLPAPLYAGYYFGGWYTAANGSGELITNDTIVKITGPQTLRAHWIINPEISFDTNGGSDVAGVSDIPGASVYAPEAPERIGYAFAGWHEADGYDNGGNWNVEYIFDRMPSSDLTLHARWTANTYAVVFIYDGAQSGNAVTQKSVTYDAEYGELPAPVKAGNEFGGWFTEANGNGTRITAAAIAKFTGIQELYACWNPMTYRITYEYNGATGGNAAAGKNMIWGETYGSLPSPSRTGYGFMGWYTSAAGAGGPVDAPSIFAAAENQTLYARWDVNTYAVAYSDNKPYPENVLQGTTPNSVHTYGESRNLTPNGYILTGYVFLGWDTEPYGGGTFYGDGAQVTNLTSVRNGTVVLYAQWDAVTYLITYERNDPPGALAEVSGTTPPTSHAYDQNNWIAANGFRLTGWTFTEWNTKADGTGSGHIANALAKNLSDNGDAVLYAMWRRNSYTVVYEKNTPGHATGAVAGEMEQTQFHYDAASALTHNTYELIGWRFGGWTRNSNGTGSSYSDGTSVANLTATDNGIVRLYAKWTAVTYRISYSGNAPVPGITGNTPDSTHAYDDPKGVNYNGYALTGYRFLNWNTNADGTGVSYNEGQTASNLSSSQGQTITLYAVWQKLEFSVIFQYFDNGAEQYAVHGRTDGAPYGSLIYGLVPDTVPDIGEEYEFVRWNGYTNASMTVTGNHVFTAVFERMPSVYTVTFCDGENIIDEVSATEGTYIHTITPDTLPGNFARWDGLEAWMTVTGDHKFYALYAPEDAGTFTLSFCDGDGWLICTRTAAGGASPSEYFPVTPARTGYAFLGWNGYTAGMTVAGDHTFTAVFRENTASDPAPSAAVRFVSEEGREGSGTYASNGSGTYSQTGTSASGTPAVIAEYDVPLGTMVSLLVPAAPDVDGKEFVGWTNYSPSMSVTGDHIFTAVYVPDTASRYSVTFYDEDGAAVLGRVNDVPAGTSVSMLFPPSPSKPGYVFTGWNGYIHGMTVESDLAFAATYRREDSPAYTVTFVGMDGSVMYEKNGVIHGTIIAMILPSAPEINGMSFIRWDGYESWMTVVTANLAFKAVYKQDPVPYYTVTFYDENEADVISYRPGVKEGTSISSLLPQPPVKEGYVFVGWKYRADGGDGSGNGGTGDGTGYEWSNYVQGMTVAYNISLAAVYAESGISYNVRFYNDIRLMIECDVPEGSLVAMILPPPPAKPGYAFAGWLYLAGGGNGGTGDGSGEWLDLQPGMTVAANMTLKIKWEASGTVYILTVSGAYGSGRYESNANVTITLNVPEGKRFVRWSVVSGTAAPSVPDANGIASFAMPPSNVEFAAIYEDIEPREVTVTGGSFTVNGITPEDGRAAYGSTVILVYIEPENMRFVRFSSTDAIILNDGTNYYFTMPDRNVTIIAEYERIPAENYAVAYSVTGSNGSLTAAVNDTRIEASPAIVTHGSSMVFTASPDTGYRVKAWTVNGSTASDNTTDTFIIDVSANVTVTVEYEAVYHTVTFDPDNGDEPMNVQVLNGACAERPADPIKQGYAFIHWYMEGSNENEAFDFGTPITSNTILTAYYEENGNNADVLVIDGNGRNVFEFLEKDGNKYLTNVALRETVHDILSQFENDIGYIRVFEADGIAEIEDKERAAATGMIIRLYGASGGTGDGSGITAGGDGITEDVILDAAVIVILGEVNGDGFVNSTDTGMIEGHFMFPSLEGAPLLAADVNGDGFVNSADSGLADSHFTGTADIYGNVRIKPEIPETPGIPGDIPGTGDPDREDDGDGGIGALFASPLFILSVAAAAIVAAAAAAHARIGSAKIETEKTGSENEENEKEGGENGEEGR